MLSNFDWLRRSRSGPELLAILRCLKEDPDYFDKLKMSLAHNGNPGPPPTGLTTPCSRCWIYPRAEKSEYCPFCQTIRKKGYRLGNAAREALVTWGFVNCLPQQLRRGTGFKEARLLGTYVHDDNHFLVVIRRKDLQPWLREIVLYHGAKLKGNLQIFPTTGQNGIGMGDIISRAIHHETYLPMDKLRVRFYIRSYDVLQPRKFDREGLLTFEISEFLSLLEMGMVFRSVLYPEEQKILYELLTRDDEFGEGFYWGRFLGNLNQRAKDLLDAWKIRNWPRNRVMFFYELINYVGYKSSY
ncbi:MAG: hypothetical protein QME81_05650 [bacterium]|nr:hypothetical protein [bacterium]